MSVRYISLIKSSLFISFSDGRCACSGRQRREFFKWRRSRSKYTTDTKGSDVHKFFSVHFVNGRKTDVRKCFKCSTIVKCPNSGTIALHRHTELCTKKQDMKRPADQSALQNPVAKVETKIGTNKVCRLVYKDGFAIKAVVNSETLQEMFK